MIYNTEEIRLTAEEYVRCIELFYTLKDRGNVYGYDYLVVKDDKMKVYSTDGSKCQVIAKPLHRFFYNADTIDKLPLLYYLID